MAISRSSQSIPRTCCIIKNPTRTSAGTAASDGMIDTSGAAKIDSRKSTPVTTEARPVRAPSPTPDADSMYAVLEDTPAAPPADAASESMIRIRLVFGGVPSSRSRPASAPIAVIVPMVSKKSASISVKTNSSDVTTPTLSKDPSRLNSPSVPKSGVARTLSGQAGTLRLQPLGLSTIDPAPTIASTTMASTVVAAMEIRIAPRTWRTQSTMTRARPTPNTSTGHPASWPVCPSWTGTVVFAASGMRRTNPASTKPMSAMKRPMPTEIAIFSCAGTAWKTASRKPVSTSTRMTRPSITTRPIASAHVMSEAMENATKALSPRPVASARG